MGWEGKERGEVKGEKVFLPRDHKWLKKIKEEDIGRKEV